MRKTLVFNKGSLGEQYGTAAPDGGPLRVHRLRQAGRLELVQVMNDLPAYWLVLIRNFNQSQDGADRQALRGITTPWGNGVWRFLSKALAVAKFEQLKELPVFVSEALRAAKLRDKKGNSFVR